MKSNLLFILDCNLYPHPRNKIWDKQALASVFLVCSEIKEERVCVCACVSIVGPDEASSLLYWTRVLLYSAWQWGLCVLVSVCVWMMDHSTERFHPQRPGASFIKLMVKVYVHSRNMTCPKKLKCIKSYFTHTPVQFYKSHLTWKCVHVRIPSTTRTMVRIYLSATSILQDTSKICPHLLLPLLALNAAVCFIRKVCCSVRNPLYTGHFVGFPSDKICDFGERIVTKCALLNPLIYVHNCVDYKTHRSKKTQNYC